MNSFIRNSNFFKKYIGTKEFYIYVLGIAVPMILQNLVTNFVSMLDNIMVGQMGTMQMNGVSIVNQFVFVFNITVFGAVSGAGIFGTQFFGKGDYEGHKYSMRFRLILSAIVIAGGMLIFHFFGSELISLFISKDDQADIAAATLSFGLEYMSVCIWTLIPFAIGQAYASAIRECGETRIPMYASVAALVVNLVLDYGLIFGKLFMPCLGVLGAAIATLVAKLVEALVVIIWAHANPEKNRYVVGLFDGFYVPSGLVRGMIVKGCPLLVNELLWALGVSVMAQSYSARGLDVVAARNIAGTIINIFNVIYIQLGGALGIIVGMKLGAGMLDEARDIDDKLIFFNLVAAVFSGVIVAPFAGVFPYLYNTEPHVRSLATYFILMQALASPIWSYTNSCYFTLRCGGKTGITFLFDFIFAWLIQTPLALYLAYFTDMEIHLMFFVVVFSEIIKTFAGYALVKSGVWINNITVSK